MSKINKPVSTGNTRLDTILNSGMLNRSVLAVKLFPANTTGAPQYLYKKLHRLERQSLTKQEQEKSLKIIDEIFADII